MRRSAWITYGLCLAELAPELFDGFAAVFVALPQPAKITATAPVAINTGSHRDLFALLRAVSDNLHPSFVTMVPRLTDPVFAAKSPHLFGLRVPLWNALEPISIWIGCGSFRVTWSGKGSGNA